MAIDTRPSIKDEPKKRLLESRASLPGKKQKQQVPILMIAIKRHLPKNDALLIMRVSVCWKEFLYCTIHTLLHPFK